MSEVSNRIQNVKDQNQMYLGGVHKLCLQILLTFDPLPTSVYIG